MIGSLVASAAVYVGFTWIVDNAYASPQALAAAPTPLVHLADVYVGSAMGKVVNLAGVISAFGAQLACVNAASRLLYSLGGRSVGASGRTTCSCAPTPNAARPSGRCSSSARQPGGAAGLQLRSPGAAGAGHHRHLRRVPDHLAYLLTVIAAAAWVWRHGRQLVPLLALTVGVCVLGYVLYDTFHPFPAAPFDVDVWVALGSLMLGIVLACLPVLHRRIANSELLAATSAVPVGVAPAPGG